MSGDFAVIGLGQFGRSVALNLVQQGEAVLAIDMDPQRAQLVEAEVDAVVVADATSEAALAELGLERMSCVVVAMGVRARDTSIMVTALLRQRAVRRIVARATNELHERVLRAVGAHEIVNPEYEMGARLANHLANPHVLDQFSLDREHVVAEVEAPETFVGRKLSDLGLRERSKVAVVLIRRRGVVISTIDENQCVESGDVLVVLGTPLAVRQFAAHA
ncbi:MAG TPA: TrkA family potassium uptake protein [Enhygromyxa sp.]|nr:TrkA family potassium uptake protein [Enhygromyxa sp.]